MFEIIQINPNIAYILFFLLGSGYCTFFYINQILNLIKKEDDAFVIEKSVITSPCKNIEEKYEDKYLEKYNNFTIDLYLNKTDLKNKEDKYNELFILFEKNKEIELQDIKNEMNELIMVELINESNEDNINTEEFINLKKKYLELQEKTQDINELEKESTEYMNDLYYSILKNSFIMENTPNGNVTMCYNSDKKTFEYYSDKVMPYRYLETVARKYVTSFYCKPLYINIADEIKNAENKMIEEKIRKEETQKEKEAEENINLKPPKDVFVKLKNYNKESSNKQSIPPSRNNKNSAKIPNYIKSKIASVQNQPNETYVLKENANRYTHNGKFSNFNILKPVERSKLNKNYTLSYKDYAEMVKMKK